MTARRLVFGLEGLMLVLIAASAEIAVVTHGTATGSSNDPKIALLLAPFAVVGGIVAARQPRNPIGWIMIALAILMELSTDAGMWSIYAFRLGHPGLPLARLAVVLTQAWFGLVVLLPLPIVLFPDGRLPSRRWRWTMWPYLAATAVLVVTTLIRDTHVFTDTVVRVDSTGELAGHATPLHQVPLPVIYAAIPLAWVVGKIVEYFRASGERRQQLKWLMAGGAVSLVALLVTLTLGGSFAFAGIVALPISIGLGILKYRLYEIDRLISRTLSYATVSGLLAAVFVGVVVLTTDVLPFSSPVGVAASTLAAAALFNPLRLRVQRLVDRRFNRARYDAEATVEAFTRRLRDAVDPETVQARLADAVARAVEPAHLSVWVRSSS